MTVKVFQINEEKSDIKKYESEWRRMLIGGMVFLYPTETIYGLGTPPFNSENVLKIFKVKDRPATKPLPLIADSMEAVKRAWVDDVPEWLNDIAERFWPGPLTIIYKASSEISPYVHAGSCKVGVRISSHHIAKTLARLAGGLIIATSANLSGKNPIIDVSQADEKILERVDVIVDSGPLKYGMPSTVIDCTQSPPILIRQGAIPFESIIKAA